MTKRIGVLRVVLDVPVYARDNIDALRGNATQFWMEYSTPVLGMCGRRPCKRLRSHVLLDEDVERENRLMEEEGGEP